MHKVKDLHKVSCCLALRALASIDDRVVQTPGRLRGLAGEMMRERMEAQTVELSMNPALRNSAQAKCFAYLAHKPVHDMAKACRPPFKIMLSLTFEETHQPVIERFGFRPCLSQGCLIK